MEHCRCDWTLNVKRLRHLWGCLLSVYLNTLSSVSKLIKLSKNLGCLLFKFLLENFHSLLIIQFFANHNPILVSKQGVNLIEKVFGWSCRMLKVHVDACFWEMAEHQDIVPLKLLGDYPGQNWLVIWNKIILIFLFAGSFKICLLFEFIENF